MAEAVVLGLSVGLGVEGGLVGGSCHGGPKLQSEGVAEGRKVEWRKGLLRSRVSGELPWKMGEAGWRVVGGLVDGVEREQETSRAKAPILLSCSHPGTEVPSSTARRGKEGNGRERISEPTLPLLPSSLLPPC